MKTSLTRKVALALFVIPAAASAASAAPVTVTGPAALALAAVVAQHSSLPAYDKKVMAKLFAADRIYFISPKTKISVTADNIICRTSNVDIAARSCNLTFKTSKKALKGREATNCLQRPRPPTCLPKGRPDRTSKASRSSIAPSTRRKSGRRPAAARSVRLRRRNKWRYNVVSRPNALTAGPVSFLPGQAYCTGSSFAVLPSTTLNTT